VRKPQPLRLVELLENLGLLEGDDAVEHGRGGGGFLIHGVALQVEFERQTLKPFFSLDRL
jgi:hypothetical protein